MIRQASSGSTAAARRASSSASPPAPAASTSASGTAPCGGAVDDDRVAQRRQVGAHLVDAVDVGRRLAHDDRGAGVAEHPLALVGRVRRVHRHDDGADRRRGEVDERELDARVAEHADPIAGLQAEVDQPVGDRLHPRPQLAERQRRPLAVALELAGDGVAVALGRHLRQLGHRQLRGHRTAAHAP